MTQNDATFPEDTTLQDMLDQAQTDASNKFPSDDNNPTQPVNDDEVTIELLQIKIKELENKLTDAEQITKKAQSDYIHMKFDFDSYMRRNDEQAKTMKVDTLIEVVKKFTPFIDSLRKSLENIPAEHTEDPLVQGVQMVYNKFISSLDMMGIKAIESIGQEPNIELHEAVSAMPTEDDNLKGKIIQEFEKGFIYDKGDVRKVVNTAKVVVGQ
jgi:molecular chaperone GrpE